MTEQRMAAEATRDLFTDVTPGWQTWDPQLVAATRASTDALLAAVGIAPGMQVLDVASGTGEPALRVAELVGPDGHVTATDPQAAMLSTAEAKAQRAGLTNISFKVADAAALPFADAAFDAVTCRMGVMFFPHQQALAELRRVLKPGGRIGFTVWGPYDRNVWLTSLRAAVLRFSRVQAGGNGPDPCHYGAPGALAADLRQAGFRDVREEARRLIWSFPGTPEQFWEFQSALGGAYSRPSWDTLTAEQQAQAKAEAMQAVRPYQHGDLLDIPVELNLATAIH
jgi:ubiquinone/menaquinone biosynthesis C-methylase UbiE